VSAIPADTGASASASESEPGVQVWDLPLRLFHWALVLSIAAAYVTAEFGGSAWTDWHGRIGSFVLALLVFRVIWGFIGTEHARFRSFLPTPARVAAYLRGRWRGAGHNPLGALSVIVLLLLVAAQIASGLFANDDIAFAGPLSDAVGKRTSDWFTGWHERIFYALAVFIGLHVAAVLFYLLVRKSNLVVPMVTGRKAVAGVRPAIVPNHLPLRFAVAVLIAGATAWLVFSDPLSAPVQATAPPAATADW